MPNRDAKKGLVPLSHSSGGVIRTSEYSIADAYAVMIADGDPVITNGSVGHRLVIERAGDTDKVVGVFGGCYYVDLTGEPRFSKIWPADQQTLSGTVIRAIVYDDPNQRFLIQGSTAMAGTAIGQFCPFAVIDGNANTGRSRTVADTGSLSTTIANSPMKILGFYDIDENDPSDANADIIVLLALHELRDVMVSTT